MNKNALSAPKRRVSGGTSRPSVTEQRRLAGAVEGKAAAGNSFTLVSSLMRPPAFGPLTFYPPRKSSITSLLTSSLAVFPISLALAANNGNPLQAM